MAIRESYSPTPAPGSGGGHPSIVPMPGPIPSQNLYPQARQRGAPQDFTVRDIADVVSVEDTYAQINGDRRRNRTPPPVHFGPEESAEAFRLARVDGGEQARLTEQAEQAAVIAELRQQVADLVAAAVPGRKAAADLAVMRKALEELRGELQQLREQSAATVVCNNCGSPA